MAALTRKLFAKIVHSRGSGEGTIRTPRSLPQTPTPFPSSLLPRRSRANKTATPNVDQPWRFRDMIVGMATIVLWIVGGIVTVVVVTAATFFVLRDASKHRRDDPR